MSWNSVITELAPDNWWKLDDQALTVSGNNTWASGEIADAQGAIDLDVKWDTSSVITDNTMSFVLNYPGPIISTHDSIGIGIGQGTAYIGREDDSWILPQTGSWSLSFWFKAVGIPVESQTFLLSNGDAVSGELQLQINMAAHDDALNVVLTETGGSFTGGFGYVSDEWSFFTITRSGSAFKVYVDGVLELEVTSALTIDDSQGLRLVTSFAQTDNSGRVHLYLGEIMFWNDTALTAAQISSMYTAAVGAPLLLMDSAPEAASGSGLIPILYNYNYATPSQVLVEDGTPE